MEGEMQGDDKRVTEEGEDVFLGEGAFDLISLREVGFEEDLEGIDLLLWTGEGREGGKGGGGGGDGGGKRRGGKRGGGGGGGGGRGGRRAIATTTHQVHFSKAASTNQGNDI